MLLVSLKVGVDVGSVGAGDGGVIDVDVVVMVGLPSIIGVVEEVITPTLSSRDELESVESCTSSPDSSTDDTLVVVLVAAAAAAAVVADSNTCGARNSEPSEMTTAKPMSSERGFEKSLSRVRGNRCNKSSISD